LLDILGREDVIAVYAQVTEVDPGEEYWPFADWVYVVGTIPHDDLTNALAPLQPDEVGPAGYLGIPEIIKRRHNYPPVRVVWWD
jgi:hypothetical protein